MKELIFTWRIENYSFCWHKRYAALRSPTFVAHTMDETGWTLSLYPGGFDVEGDIGWFLKRVKLDEGPETFVVNNGLSFLAADGSPLRSLEFPEGKCIFKRDKGYGSVNRGRFANRLEVLSERRGEYLPQDTLTARCRMWKGTGDISETLEIIARTKIRVESISFVEMVQGLSDLGPNQKKDIPIESPKLNSLLSMIVSLTDGSSGEETVVLKILPKDSALIKVIACKLFMPTATEAAAECGRGEVRFDVDDTEEHELHFPVSKNVVMEGVTFTLQCDADFSTGELEVNQIDKTIYGRQPSPNHTPVPLEENKCEACTSLSSRGGALDDFKSLYNDQIIADVKLKTVTESFPAHKAVLCARSPVFRSMFENDMREKNSGCIDVPDMEADTVHRFLLFLYTDSVEDLRWDTATKLYYAADKYQVQRLKEICSSFLSENINLFNAIELLVLADMHQDADLEKVAGNFILRHEKEVFASDAWGTFTETHPKLAVKTMCLKYKGFRN